jgi:hypothetical protein
VRFSKTFFENNHLPRTGTINRLSLSAEVIFDRNERVPGAAPNQPPCWCWWEINGTLLNFKNHHRFRGQGGNEAVVRDLERVESGWFHVVRLVEGVVCVHFRRGQALQVFAARDFDGAQRFGGRCLPV